MKSTNTTFATGRIIGLVKVIFVLFLFAQGIGECYGQTIRVDDTNFRPDQDSTSSDSVDLEVIIQSLETNGSNQINGNLMIVNYYLYDDQNTLIHQSQTINQAAAQLPYLNPDTYLIIVNTDKGIASKRFITTP